MKKILFIFKIFIGLNLINSNIAFADESLNARIHNFYQSNRAMGMGNAFSSISDDAAGMFYNPSMLAFRKSSEFQVNIIAASLTPKALTLKSELQTASETVGTDTDKSIAVSNVLDHYYGEPISGRISPLEFIWVRPNWGVSLILGDTTVDSMIVRQLGPTLDLHVIKDTSLNYSYSWLLNSDMSFGFLGKINHRSEISGTYNSLDLALDSNVINFKKTSEGINIDFDLAFTWRPTFIVSEKINRETSSEKTNGKTEIRPDDPTEESLKAAESIENGIIVPGVIEAPVPPVDTSKTISTIQNDKTVQPLSMSAVIRNVISMQYTKSNLINKEAQLSPKNNDRVLDLGISYDLYQSEFSGLKAAFEIKNILHPEDSVNKCLHAGLEYTLLATDWFKTQIRAGFNQMYFTAGLGLILEGFDLELVTYGEEFGTDSSKIENRVNAVTVGMKF